MPISTQGKLNELKKFQKTDGSIQNDYNNIGYQYQQTKAIYKSSKQEYKLAQKRLEMAEENFRNAPLTKIYSANKKIRTAKKNLKLKKQQYLLDREKYKQKLKELKRLKNEIRSQYKSHRQYTKFFKRVQEAQKMGIALPKYITDEYNKQKSMYLSEKYSIDKTGRRNYITQPNTNCSKDVSTLIWEKNQQKVKDTLQKNITQIKQHFISKEDEGR